MAAIVVCPTCREEYEVSRDDILLGTWRLGCPTCHPTPPERENPGQLDDASDL